MRVHLVEGGEQAFAPLLVEAADGHGAVCWIASARSACSAASFACRRSTSASSSSARRLTAPSRSRSCFRALKSALDIDPSAACVARTSTPASAGKLLRRAIQFLGDDRGCRIAVAAAPLPLEPPAGAFCSRAALIASKRARAARSASARRFPPRRARRRTPCARFGFARSRCDQRAPGARGMRPAPRPAAPCSAMRSRRAGLRTRRSGLPAPSLRVEPGGAFAGDRLEPSGARLRRRGQMSLQFGAGLAGAGALAARWRARTDVEPLEQDRRVRRASSSASRRVAQFFARLVASDGRGACVASSSAARRAAAAACGAFGAHRRFARRRRALSRQPSRAGGARWSARAAAAVTAACAASASALQGVGGLRARPAPRCADRRGGSFRRGGARAGGRRFGGLSEPVPAPQVAFFRNQPLPGLQHAARGPGLRRGRRGRSG